MFLLYVPCPLCRIGRTVFLVGSCISLLSFVLLCLLGLEVWRSYIASLLTGSYSVALDCNCFCLRFDWGCELFWHALDEAFPRSPWSSQSTCRLIPFFVENHCQLWYTNPFFGEASPRFEEVLWQNIMLLDLGEVPWSLLQWRFHLILVVPGL